MIQPGSGIKEILQWYSLFRELRKYSVRSDIAQSGANDSSCQTLSHQVFHSFWHQHTIIGWQRINQHSYPNLMSADSWSTEVLPYKLKDRDFIPGWCHICNLRYLAQTGSGLTQPPGKNISSTWNKESGATSFRGMQTIRMPGTLPPLHIAKLIHWYITFICYWNDIVSLWQNIVLLLVEIWPFSLNDYKLRANAISEVI
jgi:hypothetical protein